MLRKLWMVAVGLLLAGVVVECNAGVVATWNFDGGLPANPYAADSSDTFLLSSANLNYFMASSSVTATAPAGSGNPATGKALEIGTTSKSQSLNTSISGGNVPSGTYFMLTLVANAGRSINTFSISYDAKVSGTSPANVNTWYYRVAGGAWTQISPSITVGTTYPVSPYTVTFTGVSITGGQTIDFADTFSGATQNNKDGIMDFDNIQVSAVPEPTNLALAFFGVGFVAVAAARRLARRGAKANG